MRNEYDFSKAKKVSEIKHLTDLQAIPAGKKRITIMLDDDVIGLFKKQAESSGIGYQTLINQTLRNSLESEPVNADLLRKVIREELAVYITPPDHSPR
ncbi:MAG: BrnA antitoxin family protein [Pseudohongiella sp.]|nr:BrnA antitoxin family protein [Pseudohongiella sp.]